MLTLNFASMIFAGKQEGIRWPSPRGAGPAKRSRLFGDFHNLVLNSPVAINIPNFLLLLFCW